MKVEELPQARTIVVSLRPPLDFRGIKELLKTSVARFKI